MHINALELLGCWYTISALLPLAVPQAQWSEVHLSCELDSVVAIKYAIVANSRSLKMSKIGANFFDWRERNKLQISCRHIPADAYRFRFLLCVEMLLSSTGGNN